MVQTVHPLAGVRSRREMKQLPAVRLAHELGMEVQTFYRYERGERRIYLDKAIRLSHLLECTLAELAQEPTIDEKVAAMRVRCEREAAERAEAGQPPLNQIDAEAAGYIPILDEKGRRIAWREPPKAPASDGSVVLNAPAQTPPHMPVTDPEQSLEALLERLRAEEATQAAQTPQPTPDTAQPPLLGSNVGIDEHGTIYIDEDDVPQ